MQLIQPEVRNIVRVVGQPSFIEAYERTSIYPKLTGYIEKWNVDIGDKVKKGDVLATLFVPELVEDFGTKKATVKLDRNGSSWPARWWRWPRPTSRRPRRASPRPRRSWTSTRPRSSAGTRRSSGSTHEVDRGVVDPQILLESTNQLKSSTAARDAAKATITKAEAELLSKQATLAKAKVDVTVAQADLAVAESEAKRLEAWVGYLTLPAPFDGVIVARNANTFDFVLPATGDPTADAACSPPVALGGAAPIYVVDRTDMVRIFVDIPEQDANYVHIGTKATVLAKAYRDEPIPGTVTRTSWALNVKSRTLRAEIDLPNPGSQLLPGMYAYAKVIIERPGVRALPVSALTYSGEKTFCWTYKDGHAVRTEIQTGVSDGEWIEVTNLQRPTASNVDDPWTPINGSEQVILGDLSILADGGPVEVVPAPSATEVASATPGRRPTNTPSQAIRE